MINRIIVSFCLFISSFVSVKAQDLEKLVNNKKTFLVDVRTPEEFAEGNVEGSVNIPIQILQEHLAQFQDKKNIVVFCRSGNRSKKSIEVLKANGIENVVDGGTWQNVKSLQKSKKSTKNNKKK